MKPWEKYQSQSSGPWEKYAQPKSEPAPSKDGDGKFEFGEMISNIPKSGIGIVEDAVTALSDPAATVEAIGNLGSGALQKIAGEGALGLDPENTKLAEAVGQALYDRYGTIDNALNSLEQDPLGVVFDATGIVTGGATAAGKAGAKVAKVAKAANPVNVVKNTPKAVANAAIPDAEKLYESAAKFSTTIDPAKRKNMVQTALKEGIMPTEKGLQKLDQVVSTQMGKIDSILQKAEEAGKTVPKNLLLAAARNAKNNVNKVVVPNAAKRIEQFDKVIDDFGNQWKDIDNLTPTQAQALKQELDKVIRFDKKQLQSQIGTDDARMAIRTQAKESLEALDPEVKDLNARTGDVLELKGQLEKVAARLENNNQISLGDMVATSGGGTVAGIPGVAAGALFSAVTSPQMKAMLAINISKLKKSPMKDVYFNSNGDLTELGLQTLIQSGRLQQESQSSSSSIDDA